MPDKKLASFDVAKALAGVALGTAAAIGGAMGNPEFAGVTTLFAIGLTEASTFGALFDRIRVPKEQPLMLPAPRGWKQKSVEWDILCNEIENHLPDILRTMEKRLRHIQQQNRVVTDSTIQQAFIEALTEEPLTLETNPVERKKVAEAIADPILKEMNVITKELQPLVEKMQSETTLKDIHDIAETLHDAIRPHVLTENETNTLNHKYRYDIYKRWKMLDFKGIMHADMNRPLSIPLTEVFVLPDLLVGVPEHETIERDDENEQQKSTGEEEEQDFWEEEEEDEPVRRARRRFGDKHIKVQREDLSKVLSDQRHTVILGDPGSGKSTLLRYFLLKLVEGNFAKEFPQLAHLANAVPLYIQLAQYAEFWNASRTGERSLTAFLPGFMRDEYLGEFIAFIQHQLEKDNVLLLLDGLDEIPNTTQRIQIVRQIEKFTQAYTMNRVIITSRIVGYKEAQLAIDYQPYTLADFNKEQIKTFVGKWCPAYERWVKNSENQYVRDDAAKEAERLFQATQRNIGVRRLAVNPLMLTILAIIQRQGIELPSHRIELFKHCVTTLLDTWIKAKGLMDSTSFSKNDLIKILRPLAFWMHEHLAVGAIPEDDLIEQITHRLLDRKITRHEDDAIRLAESFLDTVRGKTGILVERGKQRYGFLHLAFEEYFSARELELNKERKEFIKRHLHDSRWREVILLTIGAVGNLDPDEEGVTEIIETTLQAGSPFEDWLHRDLLFAGRCIADDVGMNVEVEDSIIEKMLYLYITSPYDSIRESFADVLSQWSETKVAVKATAFILPLLYKQAKVLGIKMQPPQTLSFDSTLIESITTFQQQRIQRFHSAQIRVLKLLIMDACDTIQENQLDYNEYALSVLLEPIAGARASAVHALEQIADEHTIARNTLLKLLFDPEIDVRLASIHTPDSIKYNNPSFSEGLLSYTSDSLPEIRKITVEAMITLAPTHPSILDALLSRLSDDSRRRCSARGGRSSSTHCSYRNSNTW